jgi:RNA polymerase sigma-70 factor (ECF subfamily)
MPTPETLTEQAFADLTDPYRRELMVHCYRMLGSPQDAEDLVQETYLRAWRGRDGFEGRASVRTWLYRIATNACLNALESRSRRAMPSELVERSEGPVFAVGEPWADSTWVEPIPDSLLEPSPEAVVIERSSTRLAMVAALQTLSARERAAVVLHDVVRLTSAEVAEALDTTSAAVNSSLQRARGRLADAAPREDEIVEPTDPVCRRALETYVDAFHNADIPLLVGLFRRDVTIEMPPLPTWFAGIHDVAGFYASRVPYAGLWRLVPTAANGQPAAAAYFRDPEGVYRAHSLHLLTVTDSGISRVVAFREAALFDRFGLPAALPDSAADHE